MSLEHAADLACKTSKDSDINLSVSVAIERKHGLPETRTSEEMFSP